jgi:hypothetical protein
VTRVAGRPGPVPNACRECGLILDSDRVYCEECLPSFKDHRTEKLVGAARGVLAEMRASANDPARSPEAIAKRVATRAKRREVALAWEKENPGPHDVEMFRRDVLTALGEVTLPEMMKATGLSSAYCWRIRRGERVPHPMDWESLRGIGKLPGSGQR